MPEPINIRKWLVNREIPEVAAQRALCATLRSLRSDYRMIPQCSARTLARPLYQRLEADLLATIRGNAWRICEVYHISRDRWPRFDAAARHVA
jgi:hypothetical protein